MTGSESMAAVDDAPPPIVRTQQSEASRLAEQQANALEWECQRMCAVHLVFAATRQTRDMSIDAAWNVLASMPLSCLDWLYTPDGWAILIDGLRQGLGLDGAAPHITVH